MKHVFKELFESRTDIGSEYFQGDVQTMIDMINKIVKEHEVTEPDLECSRSQETDVAVVVDQYMQLNKTHFSGKTLRGKDIHRAFTEWIHQNYHDISISHTLLSRMLINNHNVLTKVQRFESGVDQAFLFPNFHSVNNGDADFVKETIVDHHETGKYSYLDKDVHNVSKSPSPSVIGKVDIVPKKVVMKCPRCHYEPCDKFNYMKHLERKKPCAPTYSDVSIKDIITMLNPEKPFKCDQCTKMFSQIQGLCRHKKIHVASQE